MNQAWLYQVYEDHRRGYPEAVAGVRELQRKVSVGCATSRDVAVLQGLDRIRIGQEPEPLMTSAPALSFETLQELLSLIVMARRPAAINQLTAGTSPMRTMRAHGGGGRASISGINDLGPFFGKGGGGGGGGGHGGGGHGGHGGGFHHGGGFRRGGGGWWGPGWGWGGDQCYLDAYGRIWCWTAYGWQLLAA